MGNHSRHSDSSTHPQHMSSTHHKQCSQGPLPPARDLVDTWPCAPPKGPRTAHSYAKSRSSARVLRSVFAINSPVSNPQHQNIMTSTNGKSPKPFPPPHWRRRRLQVESKDSHLQASTPCLQETPLSGGSASRSHQASLDFSFGGGEP